MPIIHLAPLDTLSSRYRSLHQQLVKLDVADPENDFADYRYTVLAELRVVEKDAALVGYTLAEIRDYVVARDESFADFEADENFVS